MHNLFVALKADTHHKHSELESTSPFVMFNDMTHVDTAAYANVISVMAQFHTACFDYLSTAVQSTSSLANLLTLINEPSINRALNNDLAALSVSTLASEDIKSVTLPEFDSQQCAFIAGIYVWLGSSMGANIIVRRISQQRVALPVDYYTSMSQCARNWTVFKQQASSLLTHDHSAITRIVDDANRWFDYLIRLGKAQASVHCNGPFSAPKPVAL